MPQMKGSGNFLTNLKQDVRQGGVKIDHSSVKLANSKIASSLSTNLDRISLEEYRRRADVEYQIKVGTGRAEG